MHKTAVLLVVASLTAAGAAGAQTPPPPNGQLGPTPTNPLDTGQGTIQGTNPPGTVPPAMGPGVQPTPGTAPPTTTTTTGTGAGTPTGPQPITVTPQRIPVGMLPPVAPGTLPPVSPNVPVDVHNGALPDALNPRPGGLTADEAARRALRQNYGVLAAQAGVRVAEAQQAELGRQMLPSLSTSFRYTRLSPYDPGAVSFPNLNYILQTVQFTGTGLSSPCTGANPPPQCNATLALVQPILDQYELRVTLTVPLSDIPLRLYPSWVALGEMAQARALDVEGVRAQTALAAREAFYEYMRQLGQAAATELSVQSAQRRRDDVARAVEAGTLARVELLRAEATLADLQRVATFARNQATVAETTLRVRLHMNDEPLTLGEAFDTPPAVPTDVADLVTRAMSSRPEIASLEHQLRAMDSNIFATRVSQFPSIAASGNVSYANPNSRFFPQTPEFRATWDASVVLSWSPTQAFVADATVSRYQALRAQLDAQLQSLRENVELEVRPLWAAARAAEAQIASTRAALAAAEENYRVRREQVGAGAAVATELYNAEAQLLSARLAVVNAQMDLRISLARLRRALGEREEP